MEMAKFTTKSLLKKTGSLELNKSKKVTFNNTVKVFIVDRNKNSKIDNIADLELKFIEISIVDKSTDSLSTDSFDDCKATDFLVHKVIYDNYVLPENDEDLDFKHDATEDQPVLFESGQEEEGLDFVVHKVTEHEDDLIKQDSDFNLQNEEENENVPILDAKENNTVTKFSKLSIENILEHDKIIAFIDQRSLGLKNTPIIESVANSGFLENNDFFSNNSAKKLADNLVLSPPLQELSLEKIVKAHSNNILCELDISPLNSVQETDSDSDISSEGTMIMMTSEECQKNERHIRESLLQYKSMKEKVSKVELEPQPGASDFENLNVQPEAIGGEGKSKVHERLISEQDTNLVTNNSPTQESTNLHKVDSNETNTSNDSSSISLLNELPFKKTYSSSLPDADVLYAKDNHLQTKHQDVLKRTSSENGTHFKGKYLTSVEIPNDVREWKILLNSLDKNSSGDSSHNQHNEECLDRLSKEHLDVHNRLSEEYLNQCPSEHFIRNGQSEEYVNACNRQLKDQSDVPSRKSNPQEKSHLHLNGFSNDHSKPKADELENFVYESNERVERIRKRYHLNGRHHSRQGVFRQSPVRGIRPRFGSTAEILQLMQKQNNPPFITFNGSKNHMSWPCEETSSSPELERTKNHSSYYMSQSLSSQCSSQSSIDSYCEDQLNTSCDHYSISSCPSIIVHERGAPEGASPPSSVLGTEAPCNSENPNGFVYFSMKV